MRLFILSDIHGSTSAFAKAMAAFDREGADSLLLAGDYLNHGPRNPLPEGYAPAELAKLLNQRREIIIGVRGNCDSEVDQMLLEFPMLQDSASILLAPEQGTHRPRRCFLTHGHLWSPEKLPPLAQGDILITGHTHIPLLEERSGILCVNPGSPSLPKGESLPGYALISEAGIALKTLDGTAFKEFQFR